VGAAVSGRWLHDVDPAMRVVLRRMRRAESARVWQAWSSVLVIAAYVRMREWPKA
jgi:hypothetical protein